MRRLLPLLFAPVLGLLGCGDDEPTDPCEAAPTYTNRIAGLIETKCLGCHRSTLLGPARNGAPAGYNFDDWATLEPQIADVADVITSGRMPPVDDPDVVTVTPAERAEVAEWRRCGYPR